MLAGKPRITCNVRRVVRMGEDLALLYNDWILSSAGADGQTVERSGKALELVRRQPDGTWRFVMDDPYGRQ
jgi:ketosteroid isomerase-like protein